VKKLGILVILVAVLAALLISGLSDTTALVADTGVPDNDQASSVAATCNPDSASATITITMYVAADE